jgi:hypothetical protein
MKPGTFKDILPDGKIIHGEVCLIVIRHWNPVLPSKMYQDVYALRIITDQGQFI